jgi:glutamate-1-semialdehyde 2,1-aminomutase
MDAIRLARGASGRDKIVKIEGSYHGHHDSVMVSVKAPADELGPLEHPAPVPFTKGIPKHLIADTLIVPFNDAPAMQRTLDEHAGEVAAVIMEPAMMNIGIVLPERGYLQAVREMTDRHDVVLIFDEVKTGATIAAGGAGERFGLQPDLVCLAKSVFGGVAAGAFGGKRELMEEIKPGGVAHLGTFNGNPLAMRAGLVTLKEILTPDAYRQFDRQQERLVLGCQQIIADHGLPMYSLGVGAKGCVMFMAEPIRDYRGYVNIDLDLAYAHWLYLMNRGIFMPPGFDEQWTLSVQHSDADIGAHLAVFEEFARDVTAA